jgi:type VI secretion system protein ImpL
MLKYIFAAIFIALAWAVVLVFRELLPIWPAVVITVVIAGGLAAWVIFNALKGKRAAARLERALDEQAAHQGGQMRPDQQAEIAAMQAEFRRAVAALKASKLGRSGRDALGILPWYVIIGPPGAGKTTALRNSGLKFPYAARGGVRGVGGTRNCDWWLTNEAILLDTAGRWSTDDDDREEWLSFLDLLHKTRPTKPINGILVAVSVTELQAGEDEIEPLARKLRERVDEVMGRLEMVVPVYLLVTKCDLIPGFIETFGDMRDKERGQIWGTTLPLASENEERAAMFAERLDELSKVLEARALQRVGQERSLEARPRVYQFPRQFAALRQTLAHLCADLFADNAYQDAPIMRGVYFTSGTQEGRPIDRIMSKMAEAFGIRPRVVAAEPPAKPKSYFVRDLFTRVVIPDREVAVRSSRVLRRKRLGQFAMAGGALAVAGAFLFLPLSSYTENRRLIADGMAYVERLGRAKAAGVEKSGPLLESIEPMSTRLARFETKGPDVSLRFGLYLGDKVMEPIETAIDRLLLRPLLAADAEQMLAGLRGTGRADGDALFGGLMLHLLLTQPKAADEPAPEQEERWEETWAARIATAAGGRWEALAGEGAASRARRAVEGATTFYARRVHESIVLPDRRAPVVSRVRAALLGSGDGDLLSDLVRDPSMPRDLRLIDLVGGAVTVFQKPGEPRVNARNLGPTVPGAFTPEGWKLVKKRLELLAEDKQADEDGWVLGEQRKKAAVDVVALQTAYFRRYADVWKTFLLGLTMREPASLDDTRALVKSLLVEKPLDIVWRNAHRYLVIKDDSLAGQVLGRGEATLRKRIEDQKRRLLGTAGTAGSDPAATGAGGAGGSGGRRVLGPDDPWDAQALGDEFASFLGFGINKPSGLDSYSQTLAELQAALGDSGAPEGKAFQTTLRTQRAKMAALIANYNDRGWEPAMLERILMPPLRGSEVAVVGATEDSANRKWCDSIVTAFDQLLAGRYPFVTGAKVRDARVSDLEKFFQPKQGTLWQYFTENLQNDIEHPAGTTLFRLKDDASVKYTTRLLAFLKRAQELTDFLFARDAGKIGIGYSIRIRPSAPYQRIVFDSGKKVTYINTRERWEELLWPARGAIFYLTDKMGTTDKGHTEGEWGLFHLLDDAKIERASDVEDHLRATWVVPLVETRVNADFKPVSLLKPFRAFEVPRAVVAGARGCGR